jgi:hypothetical protein
MHRKNFKVLQFRRTKWWGWGVMGDFEMEFLWDVDYDLSKMPKINFF